MTYMDDIEFCAREGDRLPVYIWKDDYTSVTYETVTVRSLTGGILTYKVDGQDDLRSEPVKAVLMRSVAMAEGREYLRYGLIDGYLRLQCTIPYMPYNAVWAAFGRFYRYKPAQVVVNGEVRHFHGHWHPEDPDMYMIYERFQKRDVYTIFSDAGTWKVTYTPETGFSTYRMEPCMDRMRDALHTVHEDL